MEEGVFFVIIQHSAGHQLLSMVQNHQGSFRLGCLGGADPEGSSEDNVGGGWL